MYLFIGILIIGVVAINVFLNRLYLRRLPCVELVNGENGLSEEMAILDLRDFNESYKSNFRGAYNLPSAYLKRYYSELPKKKWLIVASGRRYVIADLLFLKRKGHQIVGFVKHSQKENSVFESCKSLIKI